MRALDEVNYIPLLSLRPAEMQALEELPERDKDLLLPFFQLGPWTTAHHLSSALTRMEESYGDRPCFVTLAEPDQNGGDRPVHQQLAALRNPENGYDAWCKFIENQSNFIPAVQLHTPTQLNTQVSRLHSLGRGLIVSVEQAGFAGLTALAQIIGTLTDAGSGVVFLLDFGKIRDANAVEGRALDLSQQVLQVAPQSFISISASSFPDSFGTCTGQEIYERVAFNNAASKAGTRLIYSDRGSARAERQLGGGGPPIPRIDYPLRGEWKFFRSEDGEDRIAAYIEQAQDVIRSSDWDADLRIWGTQMIERTALGDHSAIVSPKRSTAARINIHLHRQLFYGNPDAMYDTDDEWSD
ncbi:beta family protein [Granulibacter bethesdensis]|uniref:Protein beta n=1 Tax=Granulibacter bethesdensis (strain ATCC BAA-1260 / CGDNIH1) TaxID=391165 RepID=Q0BRY4_GRABC|nr:beta family protein [Granulibacter bethesdensis]ABI62418.1 Hypothetical protein GbCGDNIH1_1520 [Granulibacter bethesdensis CGDNIH1]APG30688.1 Hypothetical protein GbCGDNIH2_1520 [Granulibacter bethesdensis]APH52253.1 Hypothetical protein GbCGDNIH5_1520 [Granulibacter bethesdensis]APH64946.1 Hypothetical protein GbCGDNIH1I4_1520 [Granulibacter bethesdensis]